MKCRMSNNIVSGFMLLLLLDIAVSCPPPCICKWKNGKRTVECTDKDLLIIPDGMDLGTQVLEFSGNNLQLLHAQEFLNLGLINLQKIHLARCRITSISSSTFKGLYNLVELDLSGNFLESIPSEAFLDCPSLLGLNLSLNPIKMVQRAAFSHLSHLRALDLSRCLLSDIQNGAFQGLISLRSLHLNNNQLTTLKDLPNTLREMQFQDNPWNCNCHLVEFQKFLTETNTPTFMAPICISPERLAKQNLKTVPSEELTCPPEISLRNLTRTESKDGLLYPDMNESTS